jgi:hypothetical protein
MPTERTTTNNHEARLARMIPPSNPASQWPIGCLRLQCKVMYRLQAEAIHQAIRSPTVLSRGPLFMHHERNRVMLGWQCGIGSEPDCVNRKARARLQNDPPSNPTAD